MNSIKAKLKEAGRKSAKQITILIIAMTATRNHFSPFPFAGAQAEPFRSIDSIDGWMPGRTKSSEKQNDSQTLRQIKKALQKFSYKI